MIMVERMTRQEVISLVSSVHRHSQIFNRMIFEEARKDFETADYYRDRLAEADRDLIEKWGIRPCHGLPLWQPMIPT